MAEQTDLRNVENVQLVDKQDNVEIYSSKEFVTESCDLTKCRGLIYTNDELYFKAFPFCIEYNDETIKDATDIQLDKCRIFECIEGTLIKVFFVDNQWFTSTNRKLDAFKSKWAARKTSFGESFAQAISKILNRPFDDAKIFLTELYEQYFDKTQKYVFVLRSTEEERIVCDFDKHATPVYLIGTFDVHNVLNLDSTLNIDEIEFPKTKELEKVETLDELSSIVFDDTEYTKLQGIILFQQIGNDLQVFKVLSKEYQERFEIRGNVSSLKFRYLELRTQPKLLDIFFSLYPSMVPVANMIEDKIYEVCRILHSLYMRIYIEGQQINDISKDEISTLKIIHSVYLNSRQKTTPSRINDILSNGSPTRINRLIKAHIQRQKKEQE